MVSDDDSGIVNPVQHGPVLRGSGIIIGREGPSGKQKAVVHAICIMIGSDYLAGVVDPPCPSHGLLGHIYRGEGILGASESRVSHSGSDRKKQKQGSFHGPSHFLVLDNIRLSN
jgi:hypothetical protein